MTARPRPRALAWLLLLFLAASCGDGGELPPNWRDWVEGGQTGALTPPCGLTPAARAGDSIPGGGSGFVIHTDACVGFSAAALTLHDEEGLMVAFDLEPLPDGAMLVRPRSPLPAGLYRLRIAGTEMEPVIATEPDELPMRLGTLRAREPLCGVHADLTVDEQMLEYLPQLKLSVSVDDAPERTWFDFGELELDGGRALISLPCNEDRCVTDGEHRLRVTGELAGELGTLEPVEIPVQVRCSGASGASGRPDHRENGPGMRCGVGARTGLAATPGLEPAFACMALAWLMIRRRARRSAA